MKYLVSRKQGIILFVGFLIVLSGLAYITRHFTIFGEGLSLHHESIYLLIGLLCFVGYFLNALAPKTAIPSFVWAIFFGMALQPILLPITKDALVMRTVVELMAALILFGGGLDVPLRSFKKYFGPIISLSIIGTIVTAILFAITLDFLTDWFIPGNEIPTIIFVIAASLVASTDPSAIIPSLQALSFKKPFVKDIAVAESAVNDVAGTVLTKFFLSFGVAALALPFSVTTHFTALASMETAKIFIAQLGIGTIIGALGTIALKQWQKKLKHADHEQAADPALFIAIPIIAFAAAIFLGGSGFMAAFVAGLALESTGHSEPVHKFFGTFVDRFIKPIIFVLLGAIVPITMLLSSAPLGITAAIIFILIVRPICVYFSTSPWLIKDHDLGWREALFLSCIRETGVIPAVLIISLTGLEYSSYIASIGMWVIILTLAILPPITPWIARKLKVAY